MSAVRQQRAGQQLSEFILHAASATSEVVGFAWDGRADAPSVYPQLRRAVHHSLQTGESLPVSNENTESVIYASCEVNLALRFWHDVLHVLRGLDFSPPQELQLAMIHLAALEKAGFGQDSLEYRMFHADLVGQVHLIAIGKRFPVDQRQFVERCLNEGMEHALLMEIRGDVSPQRSQLVLPGLAAA
ncbi:hypothetical protein E4P41_08535 [Geodermatophilus sp. DF01-2]|uniref:hypothetical protein n=1 Tax=Geodermatophilus sp. DF01-2 TaxID=2559610 RepID=UPI0010736C1C|nr:hypothetical protein [Geodermatophilus sp. DF01_2]TFV62037.1 hypothetical protein E4P41_08535 [Geodermatophilus sp. DF01_2]